MAAPPPPHLAGPPAPPPQGHAHAGGSAPPPPGGFGCPSQVRQGPPVPQLFAQNEQQVPGPQYVVSRLLFPALPIVEPLISQTWPIRFLPTCTVCSLALPRLPLDFCIVLLVMSMGSQAGGSLLCDFHHKRQKRQVAPQWAVAPSQVHDSSARGPRLRRP